MRFIEIMKKKEKLYIKDQSRRLSQEASAVLSSKGARISLIASFIFIAAALGIGVITSYLIINSLMYMGIDLSDPAAYAVMAGSVFVFLPPALGGMRGIASAVCNGREVSLSEIFIAFSSAERLMSAYIGALITAIRYAIAVLLFLAPDIIEILFRLESEDGKIAPILFPIAAGGIVLAALWLLLTRRLSRLTYFIWSEKLNVFRALGRSLGRRYAVIPITGEDFLNLFLSVVTCFTYFVYQAGPLMAVKAELHFRRENEYIKELKFIKSRKDGQK